MTPQMPDDAATYTLYAKRVYASFRDGRNTMDLARIFNMEECDAERLVHIGRNNARQEMRDANRTPAAEHFKTILADLEATKGVDA